MILLNGARHLCVLAACVSAIALSATMAVAQNNENEEKAQKMERAPEASETVYLTNVTSVNDLNDIQTALRNNFPRCKMYGVAGQNAITVRGTAEDMAAAKKMIAELDRPRKVYRVTYTVTESDGGKRTGAQHFALIVAEGSKSTLRQGDRVPLVTGMTSQSANSSPSSQFQYIDVGLNIDASIDGVALRSKIEQTAVAEEKSIMGVQEPVIRQTSLDGLSTLQAGKPVVLGSIDIPGTARHEEVEVMAELVK
jgi:type II secretory pathway component GspD/PulD (secretin)